MVVVCESKFNEKQQCHLLTLDKMPTALKTALQKAMQNTAHPAQNTCNVEYLQIQSNCLREWAG